MKAKKRNKRQNVKETFSSFKKAIDRISTSDKIQIFIAFISFISLIGVLLTLLEMKIERDAAYKPTILMNAVDYQISWNANGEEEWVSSLPNESNSSHEVNENGEITRTISLPVNIFPNNGLETFTVVNIGVGAAKDIRFEWDENNIPYLCNYLAECDPSKSDFCTFGESAAFSFGGRVVVTDVDRDVRLMYMLPEAAETYSLPLPTAYSILIHEIMKCSVLPEPLHINLYVEYSDVQGKSFRDIFYVAINRAFYMSETSNSGNASYQLSPTLLTG